jgi:hypothetical protein
LPGSYANYVAYKDRHNRLQYYAGTTSTYIPASSCKKCPGGTWQSSEQSGSCTSCVAGRYLPNGFSFSDHINISQCLPCTVGKSQNAVASTGCKNCLKGIYQNEVAMTVCKGCNLGLFNDQLQQSSCKHCPTGWYNNKQNNN